MAVSNWYLYVGIFLACTGVLTIPGVVMIGYWFVKYFFPNGRGSVNNDEIDVKQTMVDKYDKAIARVDEMKARLGSPDQDYVEEKRLESWR